MDSSSDALKLGYDPVNEQIIIVSACLDAGIRKGLTQRLRSEIFVVDKHRIIWEGMRELSRKDLDYDPQTLHQVTGGKADIEYLKHLCANSKGTPPNLRHHAELLLWDRARVDCASGPLSEFLKMYKDPLTPPERLKMACKAVQMALDSSALKHRPMDPNLLKDASNKLLEAMRNESWPYNLPGLDYYDNGKRRLNPGAQPGMFTVVSAVSGGGKSLFIAHLALAQGPGIKSLGIEGLGKRVLYGAWEMPPDMMLNILACLYLGIERELMFSGLLSPEDKKALDDAKDLIQTYIKFKEQPKVKRGPGHNEAVLDDIGNSVADNAIDVGIYDLWDRPFSFRGEAEERESLVAQQELGKELKIHQIASAQQRLKTVEMRTGGNKAPSRAETKGSSAWIDVGDTFFAPNLPALWKNVPNDTMEVGILKQRYGRWPLQTAAPYDELTGLIGKFRTVEYKHLEENAADGFLNGFK